VLPLPLKNAIKSDEKETAMKKTIGEKIKKAIEKKRINKGWIDPTCTPMDL
jgi:hypothetical protein